MKKILNKINLIAIIIITIFATVACSNKKEAPGESEASSSTEPVTLKKS